MFLNMKPGAYIPRAIDLMLRPDTPVRETIMRNRRVLMSGIMRERFGIHLEGDVPTDLLAGDYTQVPGFFDGVVEAVDVGSTIGDFALFLVKCHNTRHVIALEPNPESFQYLLRNVKSNGCSGLITPLNVAASDATDVEAFEVSGSYFIPAAPKSSRLVRTKCIRLDELLPPHGIDLIKIDVEGGEDKVLRGAESFLRQFRPRLLVEAHTSAKRDFVLSFLSPMGYRLIHEKTNQRHPAVSVLYFCRR